MIHHLPFDSIGLDKLFRRYASLIEMYRSRVTQKTFLNGTNTNQSVLKCFIFFRELLLIHLSFLAFKLRNSSFVIEN